MDYTVLPLIKYNGTTLLKLARRKILLLNLGLTNFDLFITKVTILLNFEYLLSRSVQSSKIRKN